MHNRFEIRRSAGIPIELITSAWDEPVDLLTGDLSPRGVFVQSEFMPDKGEHVVCSFKIMNGTLYEYCFFGEVTRVNLLRRRTDVGWPGFGIEFLDATPLDRIRIRHAMRGLPPPLPSPKREEIIELTNDLIVSV